jgi:TRAP-type C4-dicarboxylate transport system permease small subunit
MDERDVTVEQVEREHLAEVHQPAHWAYLAGVIGFGLVVMLLLIALLDAS